MKEPQPPRDDPEDSSPEESTSEDLREASEADPADNGPPTNTAGVGTRKRNRGRPRKNAIATEANRQEIGSAEGPAPDGLERKRVRGRPKGSAKKKIIEEHPEELSPRRTRARKYSDQ